jgi:hypothetical protein
MSLTTSTVSIHLQLLLDFQPAPFHFSQYQMLCNGLSVPLSPKFVCDAGIFVGNVVPHRGPNVFPARIPRLSVEA